MSFRRSTKSTKGASGGELEKFYSHIYTSLAHDYVTSKDSVEGVVRLGLQKAYEVEQVMNSDFGIQDVIISCFIVAQNSNAIAREYNQNIVLHKESHTVAGVSKGTFCYMSEGYEFPFSFNIPERIPPSFEMYDSYLGGQEILCSVKCYVQIEMLHMDVKSSLIRRIVKKTPFYRSQVPEQVKATPLPVTCTYMKGVFKKKEFSIYGCVDKAGYQLRQHGGEDVAIELGLENADFNDVESVKIYLIQSHKAKIPHKKKEETLKVVGEGKVSSKGGGLGVGGKLRTRVSFRKYHEVAKTAVWMRNPNEVSVENNALASSLDMETRNFMAKVKYYVSVKIVFKKGTSRSLEIPINVYREGGAGFIKRRSLHSGAPPAYTNSSLWCGSTFICSPISDPAYLTKKNQLREQSLSEEEESALPTYERVMRFPRRFTLCHQDTSSSLTAIAF